MKYDIRLNPFLWAMFLAVGLSFASAQAEESFHFRISLDNQSEYDLSPGGYVIHNDNYKLFTVGELASNGPVSLCETGRTPDFLYFVRHSEGEHSKNLRNAFSFDGGAKAHTKSEIVFTTTRYYPLLSFLHKVDFTDDTCVGGSPIALFNADGSPRKLTFPLHTLDIGTRENIKREPTEHPFLAQFNWNYWREQATMPAAPIKPSDLFKSGSLGTILIEPVVPASAAEFKPLP